jgi:hypothetical protein
LPIWNNVKCVDCPSGSFIDYSSNTCIYCPEGLIYDPAQG